MSGGFRSRERKDGTKYRYPIRDVETGEYVNADLFVERIPMAMISRRGIDVSKYDIEPKYLNEIINVIEEIVNPRKIEDMDNEELEYWLSTKWIKKKVKQSVDFREALAKEGTIIRVNTELFNEERDRVLKELEVEVNPELYLDNEKVQMINRNVNWYLKGTTEGQIESFRENIKIMNKYPSMSVRDASIMYNRMMMEEEGVKMDQRFLDMGITPKDLSDMRRDFIEGLGFSKEEAEEELKKQQDKKLERFK